MAVELVGLSKFKLQLLDLISEARHLRQSERNTRDELDIANQRQKQIEAEYGRKLQEWTTELASRDDSQRKLEAKVKYLEHENALLENKERELKGTVYSLLQSRDSFLSVYEESTYKLRCAVEMRDKKLAVLSEKIHAHLLLFDSIEKETAAVHQVLDRVQDRINEKEYVVSGLKVKMDKISSIEEDFVERICFLESKLRDYQHEIRRRNAIIAELKEHLEAQNANSDFQPQIEELRKALLVKEEAIQTLTSEKQVLHLELQNLERSLHKIQITVANTSIEEHYDLSPGVEIQEACGITSRDENGNLENIFQATGEDSSNQNPVGDAAENASCAVSQEQHTVEDEFNCERTAVTPCLFKPPNIPSPRQMCPDSASRINIDPHVSTDDNMVKNTLMVNYLDSENSTTGIEALEAAPLG